MNRNITMIFTFIAGVAVGVAATYKIAETKWQNIADEEIESVTERFANRKPLDIPEAADVKTVVAEERKVPAKPSILDYKSTITRVSYDTISKQTSKKEEESPMEEDIDDGSIYTIPPDEFNILEGYDSETFYYTRDNYVVDSDYRKLSDDEIKATIGRDPFGSFGEFEDDSVHVRNELRKIDYEILQSDKDYNEIVN